MSRTIEVPRAELERIASMLDFDNGAYNPPRARERLLDLLEAGTG